MNYFVIFVTILLLPVLSTLSTPTHNHPKGTKTIRGIQLFL